MTLLATHPGVTVDDIQANSGFELIIPAEIGTTEPPPPKIRQLLREIDPTGMVIGK
jgi:glutaconate CoA-transferase subunit B